MGVFKNGNIPPEAMIAMGSQLMGSAGTPNQFGALGQAGNTMAQFMLAQREQEAQRQRDEEERKYRQERMDLDRERFDEQQRNNLANDPLKAALTGKNEETMQRIENFKALPEDVQGKMRPFLRSPDYWDMLERFAAPSERQPMNTAGGIYDFEAGKIIPGTGPQRQPDRRVVGGQIIDVDANRATDIEGYRPQDEMGPDFKDVYSALAKATKERNDLINMTLRSGDAADFDEALSIARDKFPDLFERIDELESRLGVGGGEAPEREGQDASIPPAVESIIETRAPEASRQLLRDTYVELVSSGMSPQEAFNKLKEALAEMNL